MTFNEAVKCYENNTMVKEDGMFYYIIGINRMKETVKVKTATGNPFFAMAHETISSKLTKAQEIKIMDSVLYAVLWFAIALIAVTTMNFAGGWVLLPVVLVIILAFIAGRMREGW